MESKFLGDWFACRLTMAASLGRQSRPGSVPCLIAPDIATLTREIDLTKQRLNPQRAIAQ